MEFEKHLEKYLDKTEIEKLMNSFSSEDTHALLLNTNKMSVEEFKKYFPNITPHPFVENGFYYDKNEYELGKELLHEMGVYYLQEPSAMIVASLLDPCENDIVLDMCAAPGGKSVQAALKMNNTGAIIANDLSRSRANILLENIERMGISNTIITNNDFSKIYQNYINYFDKIILDAPCSGSGMFRKNDAIKNDWTSEKVHKNSIIQKELIEMAFSMLKRGGLLIYSTCSYSYEEDEEVIKYLLSNHDDAKEVKIPDRECFYKSKENIGVHLFPHRFKGEGHYICLISKGEYIKNTKEKENKLRTIQSIKNGNLLKFGNVTFSLPIEVKTKGLNILRYGVKVSEMKGNDEIYSYHLSHAIDDLSCAHVKIDGSVCAYAKGETIKCDINMPKGMVLLTYLNIPFSFGKVVNGIIKNHYPSYLKNKKFNTAIKKCL